MTTLEKLQTRLRRLYDRAAKLLEDSPQHRPLAEEAADLERQIAELTPSQEG